MTRRIDIFCLIGLLFALQARPALAQGGDRSNVLFTRTTFEELCAYDSLCVGLMHPNGSTKQPKRTILVVFQQSAQMVREIAARFGVDPTLLIAVITTEHTLNVQIDDVVQDILTRTPVAPSGRLGPIHVSYGFGQIYADAANAAEPIAAEIERRTLMDSAQVSDRLKTIEGALTYAAALLVHAKRTYARAGLEIEQYPGLLATLYNIGKVEKRVQRTRAEQRRPQVNYFGWFVEQHWNLFASILEDQLPVAFVTEMDLEAERVQGRLGYADHYPIYFLRDSIPLFFRPDSCRDVDSGDSNVDAYQRVLAREMVPKAERGRGKFNVLQQALGCQGEVWALARFSTGSVGWLRQSDTQRALEFRYEPRACSVRDFEPCLEKIRALIPDADLLGLDRANGILNLKLVGFSDDARRDYRQYSDECYDPEKLSRRMVDYDRDQARKAQLLSINRNNASGTVAYVPIRRRESLLTSWNLSPERPFSEDQYWYRGAELEEIRRAIQQTTEALEKATGLRRGLERPANLVSRLLGFVVSFERYCQSGSCIGPRPELLRSYLGMLLPLERLRNPLHFAAILERLGNSPSIEGAYDVNSFLNYERMTHPDTHPGPLEFYASRDMALNEYRLANLNLDEQVKTLETACGEMQGLSSEAANAWREFNAKIAKHLNERYVPDLWFSGDRLGQTIQSCEALSQLVQMTEGKLPRQPIQTSIPCPGRCWIHASTLDQNQVSLDLSILQSFHLSRDQAVKVFKMHLEELSIEFQSALKLVHESLAAGSGNGGRPQTSAYTWSQGCLYDPEATIARIERLLQVDCVDHLLIPNEVHLVRRFSHPGARGSMVVISETDRFQITLKPSCRDRDADHGQRGSANEIY